MKMGPDCITLLWIGLTLAVQFLLKIPFLQRTNTNYFSAMPMFIMCILFYSLAMYILLKVVISQGFICPLCMKRCRTAIDLSEHYQKVHAENEARGQELLNDSSVTVGLVYFILAVRLWVAQNSFVFLCLGVS